MLFASFYTTGSYSFMSRYTIGEVYVWMALIFSE